MAFASKNTNILLTNYLQRGGYKRFKVCEFTIFFAKFII